MPIIDAVKVDRVSYDYGQGKILDDISFSVEEGDLLGMIGPNGAGKTTLFNCMLGLIEDYDGRIEIFGEDIRKSRKVLQQIGYVPQKKSIEQGFPATVEDIVSLGATRKPSKGNISQAIETVGLLDFKDRRIGELSGGQQQRVFIAKALVNEPRLMILDEPATGIDQETQNKFYSLVKKLNKENHITIIWSSHDLEAINSIANKVACINRSMFFHGKSHEFFDNPELLRKYSESSMQAHMHDHYHHHH
ncbi:ABC uptake transporter, ATP-binding protein [Candidatus Nitrososphaera gargensis Ga9.2]|uniref:ABC uptake transporter, ATP-binding protein n=1 Tax=Nitrososphaera gargensis (strain Ga9.2) TaxID=1237085 RepID=K0IED0_NITGG|nr:metal ABC transporter ATP-binding protein [Candidatus Nitrososphaera gargensis]AFU59681.1 ABC uptake transporter, ATP-binding protein [Candidatus Nitrososphaera gargensis Ga9.2]